ncbi:hypothetical protein BDZ89DRAFT_1249364 [Hymenopellis radicata]|nr:hypothetical protein BDZ89DRAFT_1249364 [Hymenopellis radicata]
MADAEKLYLILAKAHLIGFHLDPTEWSIPEWEKDWRSVMAHNHDISVPSLASIRTCPEGDGLPSHLLCRLAVVVAYLQREICTVMARREERVARVVEIEADVRM